MNYYWAILIHPYIGVAVVIISTDLWKIVKELWPRAIPALGRGRVGFLRHAFTPFRFE